MTRTDRETDAQPAEIVAIFDLVWRELRELDWEDDGEVDAGFDGEALTIMKYTRSPPPPLVDSSTPSSKSSETSHVSEHITYKAFFHSGISGGSTSTFTCSASADEMEFYGFQPLESMEEIGYSLTFEAWDVVDDSGCPFLRWHVEFTDEPGAWGWAKRRRITNLSGGEEARLDVARGRFALEDEGESETLCEEDLQDVRARGIQGNATQRGDKSE